MTSTKMPFQPKERLNWLAHLYYLRGDYSRCEKVNLVAESDYSKYLMGLINLRMHGDIKKSLKYFNLVHSTNENLYCKAVAKCIMLSGRRVRWGFGIQILDSGKFSRDSSVNS